MKKIILACLLSTSVLVLASGTSSAIENAMHSKYCMGAQYDPICMGPKMMKMRMMMMKMDKTTAIGYRTKYCRGAKNAGDPICEPKMMNSTKGY